MTTRRGPIYEVTFFVDHEVVDEFDRWLEDHVCKSLRIAAVADCQVFPIADGVDGHARRILQHVIETDDALDDFIDGAGADAEAEVATAFGEHVVTSSRVLREDTMHDAPGGESPNCLNCGARLRGQYCGNCGQRFRSRLISLWELITDAFGDLFELDSRLWQTLVPLVVRPGLLTLDYLQGRRARYMPPFRMYLVMSLVFFIIAFFDPREDLSLLFEPEVEEAVPTDDSAEAARPEPDIAGEIEIGVDPDDDSEDEDCNFDAADVEDMPDWLERRLTPERLQRICERTRLDEGRALADNLIDNIPAALIVLLPLMALVLKALYPLSRRYYVEHLLFFVHFHAFFFLILTLQILFARLTVLTGFPERLMILALVVASFYVPVYLFVAMRRVYGQGRLITFLKYVILVIAYLAGFLVTMLGALAIAALSI